MLEQQRRRDEMRQRPADSFEGMHPTGSSTQDHYHGAVDEAIANAMSVDSEAFNQEIEQQNGQ